MSQKCAIPSAGAYFMVSDGCLQILLGLAAWGFGLRILHSMRRLTKARAEAVTRLEWGCMWSCCLCGILLVCSRIFVVLRFLTPSLFISRCENVNDPTREFRQQKTHVFRVPGTVFLYAAVSFSSVAIHSVAFIFVTHAMKTGRVRGNGSTMAKAFRLYLIISIVVFLTAAAVTNLVNVGYIAIVTGLYSIPVSAMFRFAEIIFVQPMLRIHRQRVSQERAAPIPPELQRTNGLLNRIQVTIRWIEATSLIVFVFSCAYVATNFAGGSYREGAVPGHVSLNEVVNSWLGGCFVLYVFAVEWFLNFVFQRINTENNGFTQAPASLTGSSSTLMTRGANSIVLT